MSGGRKHIDQICDLAVGPMCGIVNDHGNVTSGKASPQPLYDGERRISFVLNAEDDLKCWVSLAAT